MDYIGTNSQGTANAPNGMSDQLLGTWFQPGFPFLGAGHCAILPWPHVRNQEKRFPREHFTFAREEKRFAREHFALLVSKSDLLVSVSLLLVGKSDLLVSISLLLVSKSDFLVADGLASFSDDPSTLRRTPTWPSARVRRRPHSKSNSFFKNFHERCIFRPLSRVLWGVFFSV